MTIEIKPDWSKAPEWAKYWAVDIDGSAFWYAKLPEPNLSDDGKEDGIWIIGESRPESDEGWVQNWKETLCVRPEADQQPIQGVSMVYFVHDLDERIEDLNKEFREFKRLLSCELSEYNERLNRLVKAVSEVVSVTS